jgi:hypothetical protein
MGERKGILASRILVLLFLSLESIAWGSNPRMSGDRLREPQDRLGVERLLALLDSACATLCLRRRRLTLKPGLR